MVATPRQGDNQLVADLARAAEGADLVAALDPWREDGRAVVVDSTPQRARGGEWHRRHRAAGVVPHSSIDTETHWTKSGWHGWVYGWKLHLVSAAAAVWIPLAADLTPANVVDNEAALALLDELPAAVCFALGAVFVYQLALLHRYQSGSDLRRGLKPFLCAA